jgi:hypothetical protein
MSYSSWVVCASQLVGCSFPFMRMHMFVHKCMVHKPYFFEYSMLEWEPTRLTTWLPDTLRWYDSPENAAYTMAYALKR